MNPEVRMVKAAAIPPSHYTTKATSTREDLFRELDYLIADLVEADQLLDSRIRRRVTRIRALASTLLPAQPKFKCGFDYGNGQLCGLTYRTELALRNHQKLIHQ